jgi:hypothetical protein
MPNVRTATLSTPDPARTDAKEAPDSVNAVDSCPVPEVCIDEYLWSLYQRTPKRDPIKVMEQRKVTVVKKGKLRTIIQKLTQLVREDFTWKDPKAAEKADMPLMEYVIGGMDRSFKLKLYHALRAMDEAGLAPGITSAFRDDYRQSLASGLKAATDRSYHGGSFRGGYGHGFAADLVSVNGDNDAQRCTANGKLWNWIDAHPEFGIGRPYLDKDPAHVAPIDGKEYVDHRSRAVWRVRAWSRVPSVISQFSSYFAAKITSASVGYARTGELVCCLFFGSFPWTFSTAPQFATLGGRSALREKN